MSEFLSKFNGGEVIGFVAVLGGLLIPTIAVITFHWRRARAAELEAGLKQQMLEKGMSAAEIVQVMNAGHETRDSSVGSTGDEALDKAQLTQRMIDNGYEGEDIERVLKAYQGAPKPVEERVSR